MILNCRRRSDRLNVPLSFLLQFGMFTAAALPCYSSFSSETEGGKTLEGESESQWEKKRKVPSAFPSSVRSLSLELPLSEETIKQPVCFACSSIATHNQSADVVCLPAFSFLGGLQKVRFSVAAFQLAVSPFFFLLLSFLIQVPFLFTPYQESLGPSLTCLCVPTMCQLMMLRPQKLAGSAIGAEKNDLRWYSSAGSAGVAVLSRFLGGNVKEKRTKERRAGMERGFSFSGGTEIFVRGGHPSNSCSAQVEHRGWKGNSCSRDAR